MSNGNQGNSLAYGSIIPKLTLEDCQDMPVALTIRSVREQDMAPKNARRPDVKLIITFAEQFEGDNKETQQREYVVNTTSYKTLCTKLGGNYNAWAGKTIVMAPTTNTFNDQTFEKMHVAALDRWDKVVAATAKATAKAKTPKAK